MPYFPFTKLGERPTTAPNKDVTTASFFGFNLKLPSVVAPEASALGVEAVRVSLGGLIIQARKGEKKKGTEEFGMGFMKAGRI
jgi:hypothetical protein